MLSSINGNAAAPAAAPPPPPPQAGSAAPAPPLERAAPAPAPARRDAQPSGREMEDAVKSLNEFTGQTAQNVQFSIDQDSGKTVVKVIDTQTQEVLRQIPNAEALSISRSLNKLQGLLIRDKA
ncbi:flagellar protein FlaG [Janthinobacterium sp. CG_S6]|uniref:flagellar protein FlaG n=1 Tax=Janthinobacterium sp. CG_S6 TaxID=3071707 RepID=UPI002E0033F8|nr:flagellar protein FlaG [Janthinobacterium sp. CG_S6]